MHCFQIFKFILKGFGPGWMVSCWSSRRGLGTGNLGCPESTFPTFSTFSTLRTFRCHLGQWWLRLKMGYVAQKWVRPSIDEVSCPLQVDLFWDKRTLAVAFFMFFFKQNEKTPPWLGFFSKGLERESRALWSWHRGTLGPGRLAVMKMWCFEVLSKLQSLKLQYDFTIFV